MADYLPGGTIKAWYSADDGDTDYVKGHAWGVTARMDLADNLQLFAGYSDYDCTTTACAAVATDTSYTDWTAGVRWNMATGLYLQVEYHKQNWDYQVVNTRFSPGVVNVRLVRSF